MKYRVLTKFKDKNDPKTVYSVGSEIELAEERAAEILKVGKFIEPIEETKSETTEKKTKKKGK